MITLNRSSIRIDPGVRADTDISPNNGFHARTYDMIDLVRRFARSAMAGCLALVGMTAIVAEPAQAAYVQNFDVVVPAGWAVANNNNPVGALPFWYQGVDPASDPLSFPAFNGPPTSYAAATYLGTSSATGEIDTWLISPEFILNGGETFSFYARQQSYIGSDNIGGFANAMQARLSTSGGSTNVGGAYGQVGVFTDLKVDINPNFNLTGFPDAWTNYSFSYLGGPTTGRIAFRFYTPNIRSFGSYIGVDAFETTANLVPEPTSFALMGIGLAGLAFRRYRNRVSA
jgi:hypothetical protein